MPTYEYLCAGCKKGFEVRLSITERSTAHVTCPGCGSKKVLPQLRSSPLRLREGLKPKCFAKRGRPA